MNFDLLAEELNKLEPESNNKLDRSEWHQKRLGKLTSSRFDDMMQKGRGKEDRFGRAAMVYIYEKVAELLTHAPHEVTSKAMEWGNDMEEVAKARYEEITGLKVSAADFYPLGEFAGGTPDGMVEDEKEQEKGKVIKSEFIQSNGPEGIIEIKCPFNPANHAETLIENKVPDKHYMQIQGNLLVTGRWWCDFISFDPRVQEPSLQIFIKRVYRDEEVIQAIQDRIQEVSEKVKELYNQLKPTN
jgi:predicted phage-related endonuclease